jgi:DNA invertase Pin-like site-specific DNA recombinase
MSDLNTIQEKLRELINGGWTIVAIAEATGIGERTLRRYLNSESIQPMRATSTLNALAALGEPPEKRAGQ